MIYVLHIDEELGVNDLAEMIEQCVASKISKEQMMDWFDSHKTYLD